MPLVTDIGDPLLAHWRFGLGKVTAFTSDCKSRWAALWISGWPGYSQFWGQVLREMARNPQGRNMDVHLARDARGARIVVDVFESAAAFKHAADVHANVFFVPQGALGSAMKNIRSTRLEQVGPGRYEGRFRPKEPGVYLVRARSGSDLVSAGLVYNVSSETVSARVDDETLSQVTRFTGGSVLGESATSLARMEAGHARYVDLTPWLLVLFLLLFLVDMAIRRWENVLGVYDYTFGLLTKRA